jgi:hypothetical protein
LKVDGREDGDLQGLVLMFPILACRFDDSAVNLEILTINTPNLQVNDTLLSLNLKLYLSLHLTSELQIVHLSLNLSAKELLYDHGKREPCTRE